MDSVPANGDAGHDVTRVVTLLLACGWLAFGDGGTVLFQSRAGTFDVTVFTKGDAVRVGSNDLNVMVSNVMDAKVLIHLIRSDNGDIRRVTAIATHAKATNKMMYGATMNVPSAGTWRLAVDISAKGETAMAAQNIAVLPALPPVANYWPYIAMVPFAGLAFLINRWLRKKMGVGRRYR